jgi:hypothetical protein
MVLLLSCGNSLFISAQTAGTTKGVMKASNGANRLIASLIQVVILCL